MMHLGTPDLGTPAVSNCPSSWQPWRPLWPTSRCRHVDRGRQTPRSNCQRAHNRTVCYVCCTVF